MKQLLLPLKKIPKCHPERKHSANGLCKECYDHQYRRQPHIREKKRAYRNNYYHTKQKYKPEYKEKCRQWDLKHPDRRREIYRSHHLRKKYGITIEESRAIFDANGGYCWICGENAAEAIDHCHDTDKVRGALCRSCNLGIGHLGDDFERVLKAAQYLRTGKVITPYESKSMQVLEGRF